MKIDCDRLSKLISHYKNDIEALDFIRSALESFEDYHTAVMEEQMFPIIYSGVIVCWF